MYFVSADVSYSVVSVWKGHLRCWASIQQLPVCVNFIWPRTLLFSHSVPMWREDKNVWILFWVIHASNYVVYGPQSVWLILCTCVSLFFKYLSITHMFIISLYRFWFLLWLFFAHSDLNIPIVFHNTCYLKPVTPAASGLKQIRW